MDFIRTLPGFLKEEAYERRDENGNLVYITLMTWKSEEAIKKKNPLFRLNIKGKVQSR
jgi:heme-degrading monooxygenase HmoA